jgi:hypothetical protein
MHFFLSLGVQSVKSLTTRSVLHNWVSIPGSDRDFYQSSPRPEQSWRLSSSWLWNYLHANIRLGRGETLTLPCRNWNIIVTLLLLLSYHNYRHHHLSHVLHWLISKYRFHESNYKFYKQSYLKRTGSGQGSVEGSCEHGNELSGSIEFWEILNN